jgi:hypothetical protein
VEEEEGEKQKQEGAGAQEQKGGWMSETSVNRVEDRQKNSH